MALLTISGCLNDFMETWPSECLVSDEGQVMVSVEELASGQASVRKQLDQEKLRFHYHILRRAVQVPKPKLTQPNRTQPHLTTFVINTYIARRYWHSSGRGNLKGPAPYPIYLSYPHPI
jgi:hypothetical protein